MFEVGFTEIMLILGIALVVLGPEKLPKVAADVGRWMGRARAMARQFKAQLDEEVVKADGDWARPQPSRPRPSKPGVQDVDASPNRATPPAGDTTPQDAAAGESAAADRLAPARGEPAQGRVVAGDADSP